MSLFTQSYGCKERKIATTDHKFQIISRFDKTKCIDSQFFDIILHSLYDIAYMKPNLPTKLDKKFFRKWLSCARETLDVIRRYLFCIMLSRSFNGVNSYLIKIIDK